MLNQHTKNKKLIVLEVYKMYDLIDEMKRMQKYMDEMFGNMWGQNLMLPGKKENKEMVRTPVCDVCETESNMVVNFEIPGVDKEDIDLNVTEDSVEVKVEQKQEKEDDNEEGYSYSSMSRSF